MINMLKTSPVIEGFLNGDNNLLALFITILLIWIIAIITLIRARSIRKKSKAVVPEYDPPKDMSPAFARFILVSGREGGMAGEVSKTGNQLLTLINLYEDGLLRKLKMVDEAVVEYEIHEDFRSLECTEDEKMFLERLSSEIGMSGTLEESKDPKSPIDGYLNLNKLWLQFWHTDMYQLALSKGYVVKESKWIFLLSIFAASLTFGFFFSVFSSFIPFVGKYIAGILLLPVLAVFALGYGIATLIVANINISLITNHLSQGAVLLLGFLSWFAWFMIFGQNMSKLSRRLTPAGLELVRQLEGYKAYLRTVDKDRLSFSFNRESDLKRNRTSFSWLGIFGMIKDKHWDQWYEIAKPGENKPTTESPGVSA